MKTLDSQESTAKSFTDRMRDRFSPILDPIVTLFARLGVSPNALTIFGVLGHFLSAWFVAQGEMRLAGVSLLIIAPFDALDGALARKLGVTSNRFGAFLDSTLDRVAEIILFGGFIIHYQGQEDTITTLLVYAAITGSLMVSYARGRAEALDFNGTVGILGRLERYILIVILLILNYPMILLSILAVLTYFTVAQRMFAVWRQAHPTE